ncbi:MAG: DUF3107 family protein [Acidimicrobiia bacterium]
MRIRIGIEGAGELELEVEDPATVAAAFHAAVSNGDSSFDVAEEDGGVTTIVAEHVVYLRVDAPEGRPIGFGG